jgi:uncharacterized membrane protein
MLKNIWHKVLAVFMAFKVADGFLETIGGILLLAIPAAKIDQFLIAITQHELSTEPHDLIANAVRNWGQSLTGSATLAGAIYLLAHGTVKVTLAQAVIRRRNWSYLPMMIFLGIFIAYDVYLIANSHSSAVLLLMVLDGFALTLTVKEYRDFRKATPAH